MEIEGLKIVHALPGRVRLRIGKVKGNPTLARRAENQLAKVPGIKQVETATTTGSLLIHYNLEELCAETSLVTLEETLRELFPEIGIVDLIGGLSCLADNPGVGAGSPVVAGSALAQGITGSVSALNTRIRNVTGGLDLKVLVPLGLVFFGLRGLWASDEYRPPSWSNLLWFGFATFVMLNRGLVEGTPETGDGKPA